MVISRARDVEVAFTDIVNSFVVNKESAIRVLNSVVCGEDGIIGFHHCSCHAGGRVDHKFQFGLLAIFRRKMLEQECTETRACPATEGVEEQKSLERGAIIWKELSLQIEVKRRRVPYTHRPHGESGRQRPPRAIYRRCNDHEHLLYISLLRTRLQDFGGLYSC